MSERQVPTRATRPPPWRDVRFLRVVAQGAFVLAVAFVIREAFLNLAFGLRRQRVDLSFDFLQQRAGFSIKESVIPYDPNQSFLRALEVGALNTIRVAVVGIVLATLLGLVIGVARLSSNWLVRKLAQAYVEVVRNTPLAAQLVFWFVAVILTLPVIGGGLSLGGVAFLSNRGAAVPWVHLGEGAGAWLGFLGAGAAAAAGAWVWRTGVNERTGRPHRRLLVGSVAFVLIAAAGAVILGDALRLDVPELTGRSYQGGLQVSGEYAALLIALVVYTAAFIAEIVRGSIQAVPLGQKEAAEAMGLSRGQQLRLVVLPQALRIALPPLNSQYLNLTKNSSLALLVGYPDLVSVSRTIANQAGRATNVLLIVMVSYLALSLTVSVLMNALNRALARRGRRT